MTGASAVWVLCDGARRCAAVRGGARRCAAVRGGARRCAAVFSGGFGSAVPAFSDGLTCRTVTVGRRGQGGAGERARTIAAIEGRAEG